MVIGGGSLLVVRSSHVGPILHNVVSGLGGYPSFGSEPPDNLKKKKREGEIAN